MSLSKVDSDYLSGGPLLGVTQSPAPNELIFSRENGQIQVYNMESHCCVGSWQLASSQTLSCPAVQHPLSRTYWTVANQTELLSWHSSDTSLKQLPQGLPSEAHSLLVTRSNESPIAVLSDGHVCLLGSSLKHSKRKWRVQFADMVQCSSSEDCVCVVSSVSGEMCVEVWKVSSGGVKLVTSVTVGDTNILTGFCLCQNQLIAAGSDGHLYTCQLFTENINNSPSLEKRVTIGDRPIRLQIAAISSDYFVTYDAQSLLLWEPMYMTKQAVVTLDKFTKILTCGGWVCLCGAGDSVRLWRVEGGGGGLACALGKTAPSPPVSALTWDNESVCVGGAEVIARLRDKMQTPTLETFMTEFSSCALGSDLSYAGVVERVLDETEFWARDALVKLVKNGAVPLSLSDRLLTESLKHQDWDLMVRCLEFTSGFSESVLVDTIQHVISLPTDGGIAHKDRLLSLLLLQPFSDALLQQPLSQMKHTTILDLLHFIADHMGVAKFLTQPTPSYNMLLDWVGQIMDIHFTHLTLDPCAHEVLVRLQSLIRDQVTCWNRLSIVRSVCGASVALRSVPPSNGWLYKVETMDIDI